MITKQTAMELVHGQELWHRYQRNADGTPVRCRVNGKCKTWQRASVNCNNPKVDFRLPVKYGLKECFYITPRNGDEWYLPADFCQCGLCNKWMVENMRCACPYDRIQRAWWIDERTALYQTNCLYTEEGQIIAVRLLEVRGRIRPYTADVQFNDVSRMIYGTVDGVSSLEEVEQAYLNSKYTTDVNYQLDHELGRLAMEHKHRVPCTR